MKSAVQTVGSRGIVRRYWDGDLSLAKSCWLSAAIWIPLQVAMQLSNVGSRDAFKASIHIPLAGFQLLILACLAVGVWRATQRYQGPRFWSYLVRTAVVLIVILNVTTLAQAVSQPVTPDSIKMKPTFLYSILALLLIASLKLKYVITTPYWRAFTLRLSLLLLGVAVTNETIWRALPTATWVTWKVWVILPVIVLFLFVEVLTFRRRQIQLDLAPDHSADHEKAWASAQEGLHNRLRSSGLTVTETTSVEELPSLSATFPPRRHPRRDSARD